MTKKIIFVIFILIFIVFFVLFVFFLTSLPKGSYPNTVTPLTPKPTKTTGDLYQPPSPSPTVIPSVKIGLVGDLGLGRHITSTARTKNDFNWSFIGISPWLQSNDFNLANLESPIIKDCPTGYTGTFTFCGDTRFLPILAENKLVFNLANNHIFNYGQNGFLQTKEFLSQSNLVYFYSHTTDIEFSTKELRGIKFGFLGYDFITNPKTDPKQLIEAVKKYKPQVSWLIVSIHWGNEYLPQAEKWRVDLAHQLIDAGADIIHGHHPHVWQEAELYRGKPIFYSFGNFIFDQSWSYQTSHSKIVQLTLTNNEINKIDYYPIEIKYNSQPWILDNPL